MANPYPKDIELALMADPEFVRLLEAARSAPKGFGTSLKRFKEEGLQGTKETTAVRDYARSKGYETPHDYTWNTTISKGENPNDVFEKLSFLNRNEWLPKAATIGTLGAVGGLAAAPLFAGGAGAGAASTPALSSLPVTAAAPTSGVLGTAGSIAGGGAGAGGTMAGVSKFLQGPLGTKLLGMGIDVAGGLLGGDEEGDQRKSFSDLKDSDPRKGVVDPVNNMYNAIRTMNALAQGFGERSANPVQLRNTSMPGFGGRGTSQVPVGGRLQPQGLDLSSFLGELGAQLPPRRQLPGEPPGTGAAAPPQEPISGFRRRSPR